MAFYKKKRAYVPPGATVVWKKNRFTEKIEPTIVKRRGYIRIIKVKA